MLKFAVVLSFVSFTAFAHAGDSVKLMLRDVHAESLIDFLDSKQVEKNEASPFAEFPHSDELLVALLSYADLMEATVYEKREAAWNLRDANAGQELAGLQAAKIRYQLVMNAIKQIEPSFAADPAAEDPRGNATLVAGIKSKGE